MTRKKFMALLAAVPFGSAILAACGVNTTTELANTGESVSGSGAINNNNAGKGIVSTGIRSNLPKKGLAPQWDNTTWINSAPLSLSQLQGKVVLVEFWTFGCINCQNVQPTLKDWHNDYSDKGLVIVGMHAPEFDYEKKLENVQQAVKDRGLKYAVAIDNDFKTWNKFAVRAWPTMFLVDKQGYIRYNQIGEGAYDKSRAAIESLLAE